MEIFLKLPYLARFQKITFKRFHFDYKKTKLNYKRIHGKLSRIVRMLLWAMTIMLETNYPLCFVSIEKPYINHPIDFLYQGLECLDWFINNLEKGWCTKCFSINYNWTAYSKTGTVGIKYAYQFDFDFDV